MKRQLFTLFSNYILFSFNVGKKDDLLIAKLIKNKNIDEESLYHNLFTSTKNNITASDN